MHDSRKNPVAADFGMVAGMISLLAVPAALTLHTVRISSVTDVSARNPSPLGYTVSLLLFAVPIGGIAFWFIPLEGVRVSKRAFWWTIGLLFPIGALLDFFFAHLFFTFPNPQSTLGWRAPALHGGVPVEEYLFYFLGFVAVLSMYVWFDEYWLAAYSVREDAPQRVDFDRLLRFHPGSLILGAVLVAAGLAYRRFAAPTLAGFPGYWTFLVVGALVPSSALYPSARTVVNWRAFSLTAYIILLTSLMWEVTLALPYGWWGFQPDQMIGLTITAWDNLPVEEVVLWLTVTFTTVLVYEVVKRWQASGKPMRRAMLG